MTIMISAWEKKTTNINQNIQIINSLKQEVIG